MSTMTASWNLLRRVLLADGVASGAMGVLLLVAAGPLAGLLGLELALLRAAGVILIPYGALVLYVGARTSISPRAVWIIVTVNLLWVVDSILLLVTGWADPTTLGYLFTVGQALAVAAFAGLEYAGLRRSPPALA
ncbi:hypothetical protein [Hyalangium versicolor]|uniref:hypothetical protein n=1 Tax=Hyalangium versicolor TaxID=2861190 RepID=UPI001CCD1D83|nr:hypothetical protein [Hyalangium versicolor]